MNLKIDMKENRIIEEILKEKRVVFITTKNIDYIRNVQEIDSLKKNAASVKIIGNKGKSYLTRILYVYVTLLFQNFEPWDVVFVGFAPQLVIPFFKWKWKSKIVIQDFFISLYDTFVQDRKKVKKGGLAAKFLWRIDRYTLKNSDYIITDSKEDRKFFEEEFQIKDKNFYVLYLEADTDIYFPRKFEKKSGKYEVLYFGSILPLQGADIVLDAFSGFYGEEDIYFYFIGPVGRRYRKPIQENIEYINWLSQEDLAEYIARVDLCLAGHFSSKIDKAKRTIPGKAYIYEAMEKRMVLGDCPANRERYPEHGKLTEYVPMGDAGKLEECIRRCKRSYSRINRKPAGAKD